VTQPDLERLIDCVAVSDALDGMLLYGVSASMLEALADRLAAGLRRAGSRHVDRVWLGSADSEDALWGVPDLPRGWNAHGALLVPPKNTVRIVLVPDLSRLSLAAARAGVAVLGSSIVHLERRARSERLPVRHRWIAAVADADIGGVSRHLIERFAVRVRPAARASIDRIAALRGVVAAETKQSYPKPTAIARPSRRGQQVMPKAIEQALICVADSESGSLRPPLALLALGKAIALLDGLKQVDESTILNAAKALGLRLPSTREAAPAVPTPDATDSKEQTSGAAATATGTTEPSLVMQVDATAEADAAQDARPAAPEDTLVAPDWQLGTVTAPVDDAPEPEAAPRPREYATLRLPWQMSKTASSGRGTIVGTRRSESLQDLAITETLFAAAPFQNLRRKELESSSRDIILRRTDLRSYRRTPPASELLVLVLDYTSVAGRDWLDTLVPFLSDAYSSRAELCIVKVGAKKPQHWLRAERVLARNILVPSVAAALAEDAGTATPLADGLSLALRTIQHTFAHGRSATRRATLVVVTDGRGNVTLQASRDGQVAGRVGRQGIEDARSVARDLRTLTHTRRVLINPGSQYMRDLPLSLAASLDAELIGVENGHG